MNDEVRVYPPWHYEHPRAVHVKQNEEHAWQTELVFKKNPCPQLRHTALAWLEHPLQLDKHGKHIPWALAEYPSLQRVQKLALVQAKQLLGHPATQTLLLFILNP